MPVRFDSFRDPHPEALRESTAKAAGATLFFVPEHNYRDARAMAGTLKLVPVRTFGQALRYLRRH